MRGNVAPVALFADADEVLHPAFHADEWHVVDHDLVSVGGGGGAARSDPRDIRVGPYGSSSTHSTAIRLSQWHASAHPMTPGRGHIIRRTMVPRGAPHPRHNTARPRRHMWWSGSWATALPRRPAVGLLSRHLLISTTVVVALSATGVESRSQGLHNLADKGKFGDQVAALRKAYHACERARCVLAHGGRRCGTYSADAAMSQVR